MTADLIYSRRLEEAVAGLGASLHPAVVLAGDGGPQVFPPAGLPYGDSVEPHSGPGRQGERKRLLFSHWPAPQGERGAGAHDLRILPGRGLDAAGGLGDVSLEVAHKKQMKGGQGRYWHRQALKIRVNMQLQGKEGFDPGWCFDTPAVTRVFLQERECRYFVRAFLQGYLGLAVAEEDLAPDFEGLTARAAPDGAAFFLHRDFQSRNLMIRDGRLSLGADVLLAKSNITSLAGLAGKRIGVEKSAVGAVMLDAALKNGGLTTADVQLVYATVDEHEALFNTNKVDALVTFEPIPKLLESKGAVRLFDSADIPGRIIDTLAVREDVLVKNPRALRTVIAGHFKALDELRREPARASAFISQRLGIAPEQVPAAYTGVDLPDASTNLVWMTGKPAKLQVSAETLQDIMLQARLLPRKAPLDNLIDAQFLPGGAP